MGEIVFGEIFSNFNKVAIIAIMEAPFALAQKLLGGVVATCLSGILSQNFIGPVLIDWPFFVCQAWR